MYYGKSWAFIIMIVIVGGVSAGLQYLRKIDEINASLVLSRQFLAQTKEGLEVQKAAWAKVDVLIRQLWEVQERIPAAEARKKELATRFRELEGQLNHLVDSAASSVERVRKEAIGETSDDVELTDGLVLRKAQIRSVTADTVSFIHADGVGTIGYERLPVEWRTRFDLGPETLVKRLEEARAELLKRTGA